MNLPSLSEITGKAQNAFKRFPLTLLWAICGTLYAIWLVDEPSNSLVDGQVNIVLTTILGISWLIGARFLSEQLQNKIKSIIIQVVIVILLMLFYNHLPLEDPFDEHPKYVIRFFLYIISGHLFVFFAPFLFQWNKTSYWNYLKSIAFAIVRSALFSGVLYVGLVLALAAIDALFEVDIDEKTYFQLFIFCVGIVNTWIYLSDFPRAIHQETKIQFNKALEVFVKYILIPLVILYIIILYAYAFKILFQWELPKGWVSYLVTALAILGFVIQVIINPVQKTIKSWSINIFHPWFYILLLPLIGLLFTAIFRRISDYGITENRYFVLVIALWILGMTLYLLFSKKKKLLLLPLSLFVLTILSSFGFWGASSVSKRSQINQFEKVYKTVLSNDKIATLKENEQLESILNYLKERNSLNTIDTVTGINIKGAYEKYGGRKYSFYGDKVLDSLGIKVTEKNPIREAFEYFEYFNYSSFGNTNYDISEFDELRILNRFYESNQNVDANSFELKYCRENMKLILTIKEDSNVVLKIPLKKSLIEFSKNGSDYYDNSGEELVINKRNKNVAVKLIFDTLNFSVKNDSVIELNNTKALLLLKYNPDVR